MPTLLAATAPEVEEKKAEEKDEAKAEEKKAEEKDEAKAEEKKDEAKDEDKKAEAKAEEKKAEEKDEVKDEDKKAEEKKTEKKEEAKADEKKKDDDEKKPAKAEEAVKLEPAKLRDALKQAMKKDEKGAAAALKAVLEGGAKVIKEAVGDSSESVAEEEDDDEEDKEEGRESVADLSKKKRRPQPPLFRLRDGSRIAGELNLESLRVLTAYGELVIPITEVVQARFAASKDPEQLKRIEALVEQLGSDEFDLREKATEELQTIGALALDFLRAAVKSDDEEVKSRAEKLVNQIEEQLGDESEGQEAFLVPLRGEEDEIVTMKFTMTGHVQQEYFEIKTPYGELRLAQDEILSLVLREPPFLKKKLEVTGKYLAANSKWLETGVAITQGTQFRVTASGNITLSNYGTSTGPEGTSQVSGNQLDGIPAGALVAKIGDSGKPFLIGSEYEGTATDSGTIYLGLSLKSGSVRGKYEVQLEVREEEEKEDDDE